MHFHPFPSSPDDTDILPQVPQSVKHRQAVVGRVIAASVSLLLVVALLGIVFRNTPQFKQVLVSVGFGPATATPIPIISTPTATPTPVTLAQAFSPSLISSFPSSFSLSGANDVNKLWFSTSTVSRDHTLLVGQNCVSNGFAQSANCVISTMTVATHKNSAYYQIPANFSYVSNELISDDNRYIAFASNSLGDAAALIGIIDTKTGAVNVLFNPFGHSHLAIHTFAAGRLLWSGNNTTPQIQSLLIQEHLYSMQPATLTSTEVIAASTQQEWIVTYPYLHYIAAFSPTVQTWVNVEDKTTFTVSEPTPSTLRNDSLFYYRNTYYYTSITRGIFFQLARQVLPSGKPEMLHDFQLDTIKIIAANDAYVVYVKENITMMWDIANKREITLSDKSTYVAFQRITTNELFVYRTNADNTATIEVIRLP